MKYHFIFYIMIISLVITGCQYTEKEDIAKVKSIGMVNPASVYCQQLHGKSILMNAPQGQYANCILPSGEKIEEWALFRRNHNHSY